MPSFRDPSSDDDDEQPQWRTSRLGLGILSNYQECFGPREAFRELCQNWLDGMIKVNKLPHNGVQLHHRDMHKGLSWFTAHNSAQGIDGPMLGYLKFKYSTATGTGTIDIVNFCARIEAECIFMGGTSKSRDPNQAGVHGEGLKLAALALTRSEGFKLRIETSGHSLQFQIGKKSNQLQVNTMASKVSKPAHFGTKPQTLWDPSKEPTSNIWEDVLARISGVPGASFEAWTKDEPVSIMFKRPQKVIDTSYGELILDDDFKSKCFVQGLILPDNESNRGYHFGYNFYPPIELGRDRKRLATADKQAKISNIWTESIEKDPELCLPLYVNMLQAHENQKSDNKKPVLDIATSWPSSDIVKRVWQHLKTKAKSESPELFYYLYKDVQTRKAISDLLGRTPVELSPKLTQILTHGDYAHVVHVRNVDEECISLFKKYPITVPPLTCFSDSIIRLMRVGLQLNDRTSSVDVVVVKGDDLGTDVVYIPEKAQVRILSKWLAFDQIHSRFPCNRALAEQQGEWSPISSRVFSCDHIAMELFGRIVEKILSDPLQGLTDDERHNLVKEIVTPFTLALPKMPRGISLHIAGRNVDVHWTNGDSAINVRAMSNSKTRITLHKYNCWSDARLVFRNKDLTCGCVTGVTDTANEKLKLTSRGSGRHFVMVSNAVEGSFYAIPLLDVYLSDQDFTGPQSSLNDDKYSVDQFYEYAGLKGGLGAQHSYSSKDPSRSFLIEWKLQEDDDGGPPRTSTRASKRKHAETCDEEQSPSNPSGSKRWSRT